MKTNAKILLPVLAAVVAGVAFWMLILAPKREEVAALDTQIAEQQAAVSQAESQVATYLKAKENYKVNYTRVARLGKAVPADDDMQSLLVQLDATAKRSKVDFEALNVTGQSTPDPAAAAAATAAGEKAPPPGAVKVGSAGFSAMPFTFTFSGDYFRLSDFMNRLEDFVTVQNDKIGVTGRLLLLGSIAVTPETSAGDSASVADLSRLKADIGAAAYLVPPTEGVAGATPPAGAAPATPATDGTTPPTTTASITGVQ